MGAVFGLFEIIGCFRASFHVRVGSDLSAEANSSARFWLRSMIRTNLSDP